MIIRDNINKLKKSCYLSYLNTFLINQIVVLYKKFINYRLLINFLLLHLNIEKKNAICEYILFIVEDWQKFCRKLFLKRSCSVPCNELKKMVEINIISIFVSSHKYFFFWCKTNIYQSLSPSPLIEPIISSFSTIGKKSCTNSGEYGCVIVSSTLGAEKKWLKKS